MAIPPTDIQVLFTNYDIITYFLNLAFCSEHFISIKHRTFNINKKIHFWQPVINHCLWLFMFQHFNLLSQKCDIEVKANMAFMINIPDFSNNSLDSEEKFF